MSANDSLRGYACEKSYLGTPADATPQHVHAESTIVLARAVTELVEVNGMFESAVFKMTALRDVLIVFDQAHSKTKVDLGVRVDIGGAKQHDISQACVKPTLVSPMGLQCSAAVR